MILHLGKSFHLNIALNSWDRKSFLRQTPGKDMCQVNIVAIFAPNTSDELPYRR